MQSISKIASFVILAVLVSCLCLVRPASALGGFSASDITVTPKLIQFTVASHFFDGHHETVLYSGVYCADTGTIVAHTRTLGIWNKGDVVSYVPADYDGSSHTGCRALIYTSGGLFAYISLTTFSIVPARVYVTNNADNTVSVINSANDQVVATIPVGNQPRGIATHGARLYVANTYGNSISVIDTNTNTVIDTIPLPNTVEGLAISTDGTHLYAGVGLTDVVVIDTTTNTVLRTLSGFNHTQNLAINTAGSRLYVVNTNDSAPDVPGYISVVKTTDYSVAATIPIGVGPIDIALNPANTKAYVANDGGLNHSNVVSVINLATNSLEATVPVGMDARDVVVNAAGTRAYATSSLLGVGSPHGIVSTIDTRTNAVLGTTDVGAVPNVLGITPDDNKLYVANTTSNTVSVISTATNAVVGTITVGTTPWGIAFAGSQAVIETPLH